MFLQSGQREMRERDMNGEEGGLQRGNEYQLCSICDYNCYYYHYYYQHCYVNKLISLRCVLCFVAAANDDL